MAKSNLTAEDLVLNIIINGDPGKKELKSLEKSIKDTRNSTDKLLKEQKELEQSIAKLTKSSKIETEEYKEKIKKLDEVKKSIELNNYAIAKAEKRQQDLISGLRLENKSISDLNKERSKLVKLRNTASPNSDEFKKYSAEIDTITGRLRELRAESTKTSNAWANWQKFFISTNSIFELADNLYSRVESFITKYTDVAVAYEDTLADVRKTTGLTDADVRALSEDLENIDTRTSQQELMELARVAGKLGIEGHDNIKGFVNAANQVNLALSEDLGGNAEEAINQVGKLVDIFKVSDTYPTEESMLKVGSAINRLGASSTANEGYIVDFTKRVAGSAAPLGVSIANTMGYAATLDQLGQASEASSSVFSKVVTGMFKNTAEYANVANMEVGAFKDLLQNDANEAFLRVLEGLQGNNEGMERLVANMGEVGENGVRAIAVLGTLSSNTKILREQQLIANSAFEEGIDLTNEYNIKNNNEAATIEKKRKANEAYRREIGENLLPLLNLTMNFSNGIMRIANGTIKALMANKNATLAITGAIVTYVALLKGKILLQTLNSKLHLTATANKIKETYATHGLRAASVQLYKTLIANPYTLLIAAIGGFITWLVLANKETEKHDIALKRATETKKKFADIEKKSTSQYEEQASKAALLFQQMRLTNAETEERKRLVEELDGLMPGLINKEDLMKTKIADLATKEREYRAELAQTIRLQKNREKFTALEEQKIKLEGDIADKEAKRDQALKYASLPAYQVKDGEGYSATGRYAPNASKVNQYEEAAKQYQSEIDQYKAEIAKITEEQNKLILTPIVINPDPIPEPSLDTNPISTTLKASEAALKAERDKLQNLVNELESIETQRYADGLTAKEEYDAKMQLLNLANLNAQLNQAKLLGEDTTTLETQIAKERIKIAENLGPALNELYSTDIAGVSLDDFIGDSDIDSLIGQILDSKDSLSNKASSDNQDKQKREEALKRYGLDKDPESQGSLREQQNSELNQLAADELAGVITHEEAEAAKLAIDKKYRDQRVKVAQQGFSIINRGLSAATDLFSALKEKELAAAGDNEEKKEQIRKKYAKKEKALAIARAITDGALAIMSIWSGTISGNPLVDSIIKGVLTAAQVAMNAVQIATIRAQQFATGRYPVIGADDGHTYSAEYAGTPRTGIYSQPSLGLFSEKEPEMVVDGRTTRRLVFDYPHIYNSIMTIARGGTPQFAQGRYPVPDGAALPMAGLGADPEIKALLRANMAMMDTLNKKQLSLNWYGKGGISEMAKKAALFEQTIKP